MDKELQNINHLVKNTDPESPRNFDALRAKGIEMAQQYSGHAWSDFNLHDPGVTILEHLSYAITDIAYRTNFDIRDLLADREGNINAQRNLFYSRRDILSSNPVTVNDLRKLVLDNVTDVYNVWLEKIYSKQNSAYIKGLYKVVIQLFDEEEELLFSEETPEQVAAKAVTRRDEVIRQVKDVVLNNRNLGEDYVSFLVLKPCVIEVDADIVIDRHVSSEEILAAVYIAVENTLNPPIHFYSETDLLNQGFSLEEMYSGPALQHGFILDNELDPRLKLMDSGNLGQSTRYRVIDPSDILRALASIPGILYVRDFRVTVNGDYKEAPFELKEDEFAMFSYEKEERDIRIFTENNEVPLKESLFFSHLHKKQDLLQRKFIKDLHQPDQASVLKGEYRDVEHYFSFQNLFPPVYRLNVDEVEPPKPSWKQANDRNTPDKAKAKQLKAYLLLFEQVLSNYLAQLSNVDRLITADLDEDTSTYFSQPLYNVPGVANILKDFYVEEKEQTEIYWEKFKANNNNGYIRFLQAETETDEIFQHRKSRVLDHLMSRFNLNLKKYPVVFFSHLYHPEEVDEKITKELAWKSGLLKDIVLLSRNRNQSWNYTGSAATPGFENLMCRLLYIQDTTQKKLATVAESYLSRFNFQERDIYAARSDKKMSSVQVEWNKGAQMDLLITEEEMNALLNEPDTEKSATQGLVFAKQPISFLKDGLDSKHFRIGPDIDNTGFILIYKAASEKKWTRAGRFDSWQSASNALGFLQSTLRDFNIGSEGFHLVEHILLRPSLSAKSFGFNFYDEKGHVLFYQSHWMDFKEREEALQNIMTIADAEIADHAAIAQLLNFRCWINHWHNDKLVKSYNSKTLYESNPELAGKLFDKMIRNIRSLRKKKMKLYPGIENTVSRLHEAHIREDFFHFRMTVVFPSWPARFQDKGFRTFAENLFREYTPAHLKLQFKWLGIEKMKKFEALFFEWKESMGKEIKTTDDIDKNDRLISHLNDGVFSVS